MTAPCQRLIATAAFQRLVVAVIIASGVLVGLETNPTIAARFGPWLRVADNIVLGVFLVELALRLGAHGSRPWKFFRDGWNTFDLVVVVLCLLPASGPFAAVLRLARVLRLLRLVSALPKLQLLVGALLRSLGAMGYVALLLALISYIYAVAGVHLFGAQDPAHFGSLGPAFHSLLRVITLDNWSEIFHAALGPAPVAAVLYFISFILLGTMIMLNLFIGIIMNSMSTQHTEMENDRSGKAINAPARETVLEELSILDRQIEALREQTARLRQRLHGTTKEEMSSTTPLPPPKADTAPQPANTVPPLRSPLAT